MGYVHDIMAIRSHKLDGNASNKATMSLRHRDMISSMANCLSRIETWAKAQVRSSILMSIRQSWEAHCQEWCYSPKQHQGRTKEHTISYTNLLPPTSYSSQLLQPPPKSPPNSSYLLPKGLRWLMSTYMKRFQCSSAQISFKWHMRRYDGTCGDMVETLQL